MRINAQSFKSWMKANFNRSTLSDIATHGANCGFYKLSYYTDTCALYKKFKDEIFDMLHEDTEALGYDNIFALMASFGGAQNVECTTTFENLLVWYAAERIAHNLTDR